MIDKQVKRLLKRAYKHTHPWYPKSDGVIHSMRDGEIHAHKLYDEDGVTVFGFIDLYDASFYNSIDEYIDTEIRIPYIRTPYDCTGQLFTSWIDYHANPDGSVSFVHRINRDW